MNRIADRLRYDAGQAMVVVVVGITAMVGMAGVVVDVGSWFRGQRHLQTVVDAAALAGVQDLPDLSQAAANAQTYAQQNWPGVASPVVTFPDSSTIDVRATQPLSGIFSKIYGAAFSSINVHAHARARVGVPSSLSNIAPIVVKNTQPMLTGAGCGRTTPCFGSTHPTTLNFNESVLSSSSFGLIELSCPGAGAACKGTASSSEIVGWINDGFSGVVSVQVDYPAVGGAKIGPVRDAINSNLGRALLFPVFDTANDTAKTFHVASWAAFVIDTPLANSDWKNDAPSCRPTCKTLHGYFTQLIVSGFLSAPGSGPADYGVRVVGLIG